MKATLPLLVITCLLTLPITHCLAADSPVTNPSSTQPSPHLSAPLLPTDPGHHYLRFYSSADNKPLDLCVIVSNSKKIAQTPGRVGVVVFLGGIGDRGNDGQLVFANGPAAEMQRWPALNDNLPLMIVSPQCPADRGWGGPGMTNALLQLVDILSADPRVDPDRIYLTGLSLGGKGTWLAASTRPSAFAAIAPISPARVPVETTIPTLKNLPIWLIVGANDNRITEGARAMSAALTAEGANIIYSELPGQGHQSWEMIYPKLEFYDWLASHTRGKTPTKIYTSDELFKIAAAPLNDPITDKIVKDFSTFAPYWLILNCAHDNDPGLHPDLDGHKNVMSVTPLNSQTACLMQTTWKIPPDKHAELKLLLGHPAQTAWRLTVNVNSVEIFSKPIDQTTAPDGWLETSVDLAPYTGKNARIDVLAHPTTPTPTPAYFGKLSVEWP